MPRPDLAQTMRLASENVLETMFFAEALDTGGSGETLEPNALACTIQCDGAEYGTFSLAVDRDALVLLCEAFYGETDTPSTLQQEELLCELTNMVAGSTLSRYAPSDICGLSTPRVFPYPPPEATTPEPNQSARIGLALDGGLLSLACTLRLAA